MNVLLQIFVVGLVTGANGNDFLTLGKASIENMKFDPAMTRDKVFWEDWFEEFRKAEDGGELCQQDGFIPDRSACQKFYRCQWLSESDTFRKYEFNCAPGMVFDTQCKKCDAPLTAKTVSGCKLPSLPNATSPGLSPLANTTSAGFETDKFCIYDLDVSYIYGSPDGVYKRMIAFNGQFPGPTLICTRGKYMVVRVTNNIEDDDEPISVHWHGIEQNLSPFYDGPAAVTQCPIIRGTFMIYMFQLFQSGTYWYHSHHSYQYVDGAWGFLLIRNVPTEVWRSAYDDELTISINDWIHRPARNVSETYLTHGAFPFPDSSLINGKGTFNCSLIQPGQLCDPNLQGPAVVNVVRGFRYRLRVLSASGSQSYNFSIDGHKLIVIETDGVDTYQSRAVDVVNIFPAQRYSFLVSMDKPLREYWIRITSAGPISDGLKGLAILRYPTAVSISEVTIENVVMPSAIQPEAGALQGRPDFQDIPWSKIASRGGVKPATRSELQAFFPAPPPSTTSRQDEIQTEQIVDVRTPTTSPVDPSTAVLLNQMDCLPYDVGGNGGAPDYYDELVVINVDDCPTPSNPARLCMNGLPFIHASSDTLPVLFQAIRGNTIAESYRPIFTNTLGKVIRIVMNNRHPFPHPWHLHGHTMWVLGDGPTRAGDFVPARDNPSLNVNGVRRDTSFSLGNSWTVFTYVTDNPGTWLLHCHINWHFEAGLAITLIEATEVSQQIYQNPPPQSYLTCAAVGVDIS